MRESFQYVHLKTWSAEVKEREEDMTEKKRQSYGDCKNAPEHSDHMCILMEKGQTEEIRRRSLHPAYACGNCEARADRAEDLCNPKPL